LNTDNLFLGVDAGGTHTTAVVGTADLTVLARAHGPGAAMRPGGAERSATVIVETIRRAATQAGRALPGERLVIGAAGAGRAQEQEELAAVLESAQLARHIRVMGDGEVALAAAFASGPGVVVNAGTGSVAHARDPDGGLHRCGGYGWQLGDEGGGYWVARRALEAASRAYDGRGEGTTLLTRLLSALGLKDFDALIRWATTATPAQVASLAPHLLNAAREGEGVAQAVVAEAARELVGLVVVLARHFPARGPITVATTGGLLAKTSPLLAAFRDALVGALPGATVSDEPIDPPVGALRLAAIAP